MSQEDVELLRDGFERLATEGFEAMTPLIHPEFAMETPASMAAEPQRYEGVEGFKRWWTSFYEVMEEVVLEPKGITDFGPSQVAVELHMRATGHASGIETAQDVVMVVTVRTGQMAWIDFYGTLEEALPGGRP